VHYLEYDATQKAVRVIPEDDHYRPREACPVVGGIESAETIADALGVELRIVGSRANRMRSEAISVAALAINLE
jgi:hypothetical protein